MKQLTYVPQSDFFIGREDLLERIRYSLQHEGSIVNLYGMGGIGKTTLAAEYACHSIYQKLYEQVVWIEYRDSIPESFIYNEELLRNLKVIQKVNDIISDRDIADDHRLQRAFEQILVAINTLPGLSLIVLDNLDNEENLTHNKRNLRALQSHIILTSRSDFEDVLPINVDKLTLETSRALFWRHYKRGNAALSLADEARLDALLSIFENHTLLTEMLGKIAHRMSYSLEKLEQYVRELSIRDESWQIEVGTGLSGETHGLAKETLSRYMTYVFRDIRDIRKEEKDLLRLFSVLPTKSYSIGELAEFFGLDILPLQRILSKLYSTGIPVKQGQSWILHPLFREVCLRELEPFTAQNCSPIINAILSPLKIRHNLRESFNTLQYLPYALELLRYLNHHDMRMSELMINVAEVYYFWGNNPQAFHWANKLLSSLSPEDMEIIMARSDEIFSGINIDLNESEMDTFIMHPLQWLDLFVLLCQLYSKTGNYLEAKKWAVGALDNAKMLYSESSGQASTQNNLAAILIQLNDLGEAEELLKHSLEIYKREDIKSGLGAFYSNYGMLLCRKGDFSKAFDLLLLSVEQFKQELGEDHIELSTTYSNLATVLMELNEFASAKQWLEKSIDLITNKFGEDSPGLLSTPYGNLGTCFRDMGQIEEAKLYLEKAFSFSVMSVGAESLKSLEHGSILASFYWKQNWHEQARDVLHECLQHVDIRLAADQLHIASAFAKYGTLLSLLNEPSEGIKHLETALSFELAHSPISYPEIAIWKHNLADAYLHLGEKEKADKIIKQAREIYEVVKQLQDPKYEEVLVILERAFGEQ